MNHEMDAINYLLRDHAKPLWKWKSEWVYDPEENNMDWFTALQFGLFAAAQGVKLAETFGDEDVPGEKKKMAAEKLAMGALAVARNRGAMDDEQFGKSVEMMGEFSQLAFEAFDLAGIVNKGKRR